MAVTSVVIIMALLGTGSALQLTTDSCGNVQLADGLHYASPRTDQSLSASHHIVVDQQGDIYYISEGKVYVLEINSRLPRLYLNETLDTEFTDIGMYPANQSILVSSKEGFGTISNGEFQKITNTSISSFVVSEDSTVFYSDMENDMFWMRMDSQESKSIPGAAKGSLQDINHFGDLLYIDEHIIAKVWRNGKKKSTKIRGVPRFDILLMAEDRRNNITYISVKGKLLYLNHKTGDPELLIASITVTSMGFDSKGDTYMIIDGELVHFTMPKDELCFKETDSEVMNHRIVDFQATTVADDETTIKEISVKPTEHIIIPVEVEDIQNTTSKITTQSTTATDALPETTTKSSTITDVSSTTEPSMTTIINQTDKNVKAAGIHPLLIPIIIQSIIILFLVGYIIIDKVKRKNTKKSGKKKADEIEMMRFSL